MNIIKKTVVVFASVLLASSIACTTTNRYSGEKEIDGGKTALLLGGLALAGATAYAVSEANDDKERHPHHRTWHEEHARNEHRRGQFSPEQGVTCYDYQAACYHHGHYSNRWSNRIYR